jgi:hypothetical protein
VEVPPRLESATVLLTPERAFPIPGALDGDIDIDGPTYLLS